MKSTLQHNNSLLDSPQPAKELSHHNSVPQDTHRMKLAETKPENNPEDKGKVQSYLRDNNILQDSGQLAEILHVSQLHNNIQSDRRLKETADLLLCNRNLQGKSDTEISQLTLR